MDDKQQDKQSWKSRKAVLEGSVRTLTTGTTVFQGPMKLLPTGAAGLGGGGGEAIKTVSEFQKSPLSFCSLNGYIFVCQMESHSGCTLHTLTCLSVDVLLYHYPLCVDSMLF